MTGLKRYDISIGVSGVQDEKGPSLYVKKDEAVYQVGKFNSKEDADLFFAALDYVAFDNFEDKLRELLRGREDNSADSN